MPTTHAPAHRRRIGALLITSVLLLAACSGGGYGGSTDGGGGGITNPPAGPAITTAVTLTGSAFTPPDIQVAPNATVTFTNNDGFNHNVTFTNTAITGTGNFATGARTVTAPSTAGTYAYHCSIHSSMTGSVKVQ